MNGHFSREARDIAISLYYFARCCKRQSSSKDLETFSKLLNDLKYLQVDTLNSQHVEYLIEGIHFINHMDSSSEEFLRAVDIAKNFMPKLIDLMDNELHKFRFRNLINIV